MIATAQRADPITRGDQARFRRRSRSHRAGRKALCRYAVAGVEVIVVPRAELSGAALVLNAIARWPSGFKLVRPRRQNATSRSCEKSLAPIEAPCLAARPRLNWIWPSLAVRQIEYSVTRLIRLFG